jgi:hypothetical protein
VPSLTTFNDALNVRSTADAARRRVCSGLRAKRGRTWSPVQLQLQGLPRSRDAGASRATVEMVVRFYTTVPTSRERTVTARWVSTSTKELRSQMERRRADAEPVRRRLPCQPSGRAWSRTRAAVPRAGSIRPARETAPPIAIHRGVAQDDQDAVFCQDGGARVAPSFLLRMVRPFGLAAAGMPLAGLEVQR